MMQGGLEKTIAVGLGVIVLALAGIIALELRTAKGVQLSGPEKSSSDPANSAVTDFDPSVQSELLDVPPLAHYAELLQRPLFRPDRQPYAAVAENGTEVTADSPEPVRAPNVALTGIVITPDETTALFRNTATGEIARVQKGAEVEGWVLEEVKADRVLLKHDDEIHEVLLRPPLPKADAPPPAPKAARQPRAGAQARDVNGGEGDQQQSTLREKLLERLKKARQERQQEQ